MHFLNLTLEIRFQPVLGSLSRLKEIAPQTSMQMVRSHKNNIIYSHSMKTNRNELIRRLLSGLTDPDDELENLVRVREEARRPIPAPRKMGVKQLIRYFENNNLYKPPRPTSSPGLFQLQEQRNNNHSHNHDLNQFQHRELRLWKKVKL